MGMIKINLLDTRQERPQVIPVVEFQELSKVRSHAQACSEGCASPVLGVGGLHGGGKTTFLLQAQNLLNVMGFRTMFFAPMPELFAEDPRICLQSLWEQAGSPPEHADQADVFEAEHGRCGSAWEMLPPFFRRAAFADAAARRLVSLGDTEPVAVLIDDYDLFRAPCADVFQRAVHLAKEAGSRICFVIVASDDAAEQWREQGLLHDAVHLTGFKKKEFHRLISAWSPSALTHSMFNSLWHLTGGLPRYTFHLLSLFIEQSKSRCMSQEVSRLTGEVPSDIIAKRLALLSSGQRSLLKVLFLCGRPVRRKLLQTVLDIPFGSLKGTLQVLFENGWICGFDAGILLKDRLVGEALAEHFPAESGWNKEIASYLEANSGYATEVYAHLLQSGHAENGRPMPAGDVVEKLLSWGDTQGAYHAALGRELDAALWSRLVHDMLSDGLGKEAECLLEERALEAGDPSALLLKGKTKLASGQRAEARALFLEGLKQSGSEGEERSALLAALLPVADEHERGGLGSELLEFCRRKRCTLRDGIAFVRYLCGAGRFSEAREVMEWCSRSGGSYDNWLFAVLKARICIRLGAHEEACCLFQEAVDMAAESRIELLQSVSLLFQGEGFLASGRPRDVTESLEAAGTAFAGLFPGLYSRAKLCLGAALLLENDFEDALACMSAVPQASMPSVVPGDTCEWLGMGKPPVLNAVPRAEALLARGETAEAETIYLEALKRYRGEKSRENAAVVLQKMARLSFLLGNDGVALTCIAESLKQMRRNLTPALSAGAHLVSGRVSVLVGNYKRALSSFSVALKGYVLTDDTEGMVEVCCAYSRVFRLLGVGDTARRFLSFARLKALESADKRLIENVAVEESWNKAAAAGDNVRSLRGKGPEPGGTIWCQLETQLLQAATSVGDEAIEKAQRAADRARAIGAQDLAAEAALVAGSRRAREKNLIRGIEILQGIVDLGQRRKRPELVLRAEVAIADIFLSRGRTKPGEEFVRRAGETLSALLKRVPSSYRSHFLAKKQYRAAVDLFQRGWRSKRGNVPEDVENLLKSETLSG